VVPAGIDKARWRSIVTGLVRLGRRHHVAVLKAYMSRDGNRLIISYRSGKDADLAGFSTSFNMLLRDTLRQPTPPDTPAPAGGGRPGRWQDRAACALARVLAERRDIETDDFFPRPGGMPTRWVDMCWNVCPVRVECLADALQADGRPAEEYLPATVQNLDRAGDLADHGGRPVLERCGIRGGLTPQMREKVVRNGWDPSDPRVRALAFDTLAGRRQRAGVNIQPDMFSNTNNQPAKPSNSRIRLAPKHVVFCDNATK